jgi:hypothetical protein
MTETASTDIFEEIINYGAKNASMDILEDMVKRAVKTLRVLINDADKLREVEKLYETFKNSTEEAERREAAKRILLIKLEERFPPPPKRGKK